MKLIGEASRPGGPGAEGFMSGPRKPFPTTAIRTRRRSRWVRGARAKVGGVSFVGVCRAISGRCLATVPRATYELLDADGATQRVVLRGWSGGGEALNLGSHLQ
jgi:hypothetical protein